MMKNKIWPVFLALTLLVLLPAFPAGAETQTFKPFVVEAPAGWTTQYNEGNSEFIGARLELNNADNTARVTFVLEALTGSQWDDMLKQMTDRPKPDTGPAQVANNDHFIVTFSDSRSGMSGKDEYLRVRPDLLLKRTILGYDPVIGEITRSFRLDMSTTTEEEL